MVESSPLERVLISSPYPALEKTPGGVGSYIQEFVPHLESKGVEVLVVCPSVRGQETFADRTLGVSYFTVRANNTEFKPGISLGKSKVQEILWDFKPDLIVANEPAVPNLTHTLASGIPIREDGKRLIPMVGLFHSRTEKELDKKTKTYSFASRALRRPRFHKSGIPIGLTEGYANTIINALAGRIAISDATASFWNELYPGDYTVIRNGIDVDLFNPDGERFDDWDDGSETIFFTGRHDIRKGIDFLIKSIGILRERGRNVKLKIAGGVNKETANLEKLVNDLGLSEYVEFLGFLEKEDLAKAYRSCKTYVASSIEGEGHNRTISEARACGAVVVCTNIPGHDEAIGDDMAEFMANPSDSESLAGSIEQALDFQKQKEEKATKRRERSVLEVKEKLSWEPVTDKHIKYYQSTVDSHGKPNWEEYDYRRRRFPRSAVIYRRPRSRAS
jgi:glycosyltransferase involved in cell wall biosynthesis